MNNFKDTCILTTAQNMFVQYDLTDFSFVVNTTRRNDPAYLKRLNITLDDYCVF